MIERIATFFTKTFTGRIIVVAVAVLLAAYVARIVLVDLPAMRDKEAAGVGAHTLDEMGDSLSSVLDRGDASQLPELTDWYPADLPCGAEATLAQPRDHVWELLGLPADESRTLFQYRFQNRDGVFEIRARRDRDCDGLFAVWLLEQKGSGVLGRDITAQNIHE